MELDELPKAAATCFSDTCCGKTTNLLSWKTHIIRVLQLVVSISEANQQAMCEMQVTIKHFRQGKQVCNFSMTQGHVLLSKTQLFSAENAWFTGRRFIFHSSASSDVLILVVTLRPKICVGLSVVMGTVLTCCRDRILEGKTMHKLSSTGYKG